MTLDIALLVVVVSLSLLAPVLAIGLVGASFTPAYRPFVRRCIWQSILCGFTAAVVIALLARSFGPHGLARAEALFFLFGSGFSSWALVLFAQALIKRSRQRSRNAGA
jgi:hypothetical protein